MEHLAQANPKIKKAVSIIYEMSADERERELALRREMDEMAHQGQLAYARDEGKQQGIEIGEQRGKQQGIEIGEQRGKQREKQHLMEIAARLKAGGMSPRQIADITGLPLDNLQ